MAVVLKVSSLISSSSSSSSVAAAHNSNNHTPSISIKVQKDNIALQLPKLKNLLQVLKQKRGACCGNGQKCGPGNVFLVGAGPRDPELLTLKVVRVIQEVNLLLYDRLVSNDVLDLVGLDARLLYVGKTVGYHSRTQVNK